VFDELSDFDDVIDWDMLEASSEARESKDKALVGAIFASRLYTHHFQFNHEISSQIIPLLVIFCCVFSFLWSVDILVGTYLS
jgi:hypothetical protein